MQAGQAGVDPVKQAMRATWMSGDFGQIARTYVKTAEAFVERLKLEPGTRVLDVACGSGNLAIPAARAGARVTGMDFAPNLLEEGREWARQEGLDVTFDEGDAEQMQYVDGQFDTVMTMFGAMFAPRPERAAAELLRVCRQGGTIAMANWNPGSFVSKMFGLGAKYLPPPEGVPSPLQWGDQDVVRQRFGSGVTDLRMTIRRAEFEFPYGPAGVVQLFRTYFGPVHMAFKRLDPPRQDLFAADLQSLWRDHNEATGDRTVLHSEFLEVLATRA